jgi:hypothetical protein
MNDRARILVFGFSSEEQSRIDEHLAALGIPAPTRLERRHGKVVIGEILRKGAIGEKEFDCDERLVLFSNLSDAGVRSLIQEFKSIETLKPIFAVVTESSINWTLEHLMSHLIEEKRAHEGS